MTEAPGRVTPPRRRLSRSAGVVLAAFFAVALAAYVDGQISVALAHPTAVPHDWRDHALLRVFARYDSAWYIHIATEGYFYRGPNVQSAVAFFPAYPAAIRAVRFLARDVVLAGALVTLACGAAYLVVLRKWCAAAFGERASWFALALVLAYPFSFYLYGAVYSDALFVLSVVVAFVLLEHDRPVLAGVVGIVATAGRPVGLALAAGLVLRNLEIRGVLGPARPAMFAAGATGDAAARPLPLVPRRLDLSRLRWRDAGPLLSVLGLVAYAGYLWWRFSDALAFERGSTAPGWDRHVNLHTIAHVLYFQLMKSYGLNEITFWLTMQGLFSVAALVSVPFVIRRLGWGYGAYVFLAVGVAFVSAPQFIGMGRYVLPAFPSFALAGRWLSERVGARERWVPAAVVMVSGGLLAWMTSLYARWVFLA